jgi:5-oxoprolinase (ATP-hydrolysing) subunit A
VRIDLNADVGEGYDDLPIFPFVTTVSVACGAHAGDVETMTRCVAEAKRLGIDLGAHPGYADREGFGRRPVALTDDELAVSLADQILALDAIARASGIRVRHVKPHGALYNQAATDRSLAGLIVRAVKLLDPRMRLIALAGSAMVTAAREQDLPVAAEAFADRAYTPDGTLASRGTPGALIEDPERAAAQAVALARREPITTIDGKAINVEADSICLHADTPGALAIARAVRDALTSADVEVAPLSAG